MNDFAFWKHGAPIRVENVQARLASWERKTHPEKVRLTKYLDELIPRLKPPPIERPLFLHLEVNIANRADLLRQQDLENYLTPLFGGRYLNSNEFVLVSAAKRVGGPNKVTIGYAEPYEAPNHEWHHFTCEEGRSAGSSDWKLSVRDRLRACSTLLCDGPAEVQLAWRCSTRRKWVNLWKPTGDTMGAVLGDAAGRQPFNPKDDRIVSLWLHRTVDETLGHRVKIGMWWKQGIED
jgi:hypothetical protein